MKTPEIVASIAELRSHVAAWRGAGQRVGLVPTMGALHAGHLSLVNAVRDRADKAVVSIFVNPTQFAPHEDFDRYPRTLEADAAKLGEKADLIFAPTVKEMYPQDFATKIEVAGPSEGLETDFRPHFFSGVATVVAKLLIAAMPDVAVFGEKDWQQLQVIRRLVTDLALPIEIMGAPILREPDGLAMSSRNAYLTAEQRKIAPELLNSLYFAARAISDGIPIREAEEGSKQWLLKQGFRSVDYIAARDGESLRPLERFQRPIRILGAAWLGGTRLIDNMQI